MCRSTPDANPATSEGMFVFTSSAPTVAVGDSVLVSGKVNDFYTKGGYIRQDGVLIHDMYLVEVKKPSESKKPWDYYKVLETIPGEQAYTTKQESTCKLWK